MKLQEKGFSLLEMMITLVIIGAVTYAVVMQSESIFKTQSKAQMDSEIEQLSFVISNTLANPESCTETVKTITPVSLSGVGVPGNVGDIVRKGSSSDNLFTNVAIAGENIAPGVKIKAINLVSDPPRDFIRVTFQKTTNNSVLDFNRDFLIFGRKVGATFEQCLGFANSLDGREICRNLKGGVWNNVSLKCDFPNHLPRPRTTKLFYGSGSESSGSESAVFGD